MTDLLNMDILIKTFDDLSHGVGIFEVEDVNDIKSIRYVFMNKIILYEMRKTREEVFGKKIIEVAPEAYEHPIGLKVVETYRKVAAEGGYVNLGLVQYSNQMVAGTYDCSVHHIKDNYVYVMLRNVTELEQTKIELEQKNKELNQFAYIVSHDLREPLRTVSGFIDIIKRKYKGKLDEKTDEMLSFLVVSTRRMRTLIDDLLAYSSIGKKQEMAKVDCNKIVEMVLEDLQVKIMETKCSIIMEKLPVINGYETHLRLLFQNLISNGIKFSKPGISPKISILAKEQNGWTFEIQDNGIGIEDLHKHKIFDLFQRIHSKNKYEGSGIGLAHCKKIVELHKGTIWVDSEFGVGSTFSFSIPNLN